MTTAADRVNRAEERLKLMIALRHGVSPNQILAATIQQRREEISSFVRAKLVELLEGQLGSEDVINRYMEKFVASEDFGVHLRELQKVEDKTNEEKEVHELLLKTLQETGQKIGHAEKHHADLRFLIQRLTQMQKETRAPIASFVLAKGEESGKQKAQQKSGSIW